MLAGDVVKQEELRREIARLREDVRVLRRHGSRARHVHDLLDDDDDDQLTDCQSHAPAADYISRRTPPGKHCFLNSFRFRTDSTDFVTGPFLLSISAFYSARNCIASAVLATAIPSVCPSVCLSDCHTTVLCQNDGT